MRRQIITRNKCREFYVSLINTQKYLSKIINCHKEQHRIKES